MLTPSLTFPATQKRLSVPGLCSRGLILALAMGLPLAPAAAQCNISRTGTPDFDQRRLGALPNDGRMYCAPTAVANLLALLANSGYPEAFAINSGGVDWQFQGLFEPVSSRISMLGTMMGTDPHDGTTGEGARSGAQQWLDHYAPGQFIVSNFWAHGDYSPAPSHLYQAQKLGGYIAPVWGVYEEDAPGLTRSGGHVITQTAIWGGCSGEPRIYWRDPGDSGDPDTIQSLFTTRTAFLIPRTANFRSSSGSSYTERTLWRFSNSSNRYLDAFLMIQPTKYTTPSQTPGELQTHNPVQPIGLLLPAVQKFQLPSASEPEDLVMDPQNLAYYVSMPGQGTAPAGIWRIDAFDGTPALLHTVTTAGPLATGRLGELFIADGRTVSSLSIWSDVPAVSDSVLFPAPVEALVYDDASDSVLALSATPLQLMRISRTLAGAVEVYPVPSSTPLGSDMSLAVGPDGKLFLTSTQSPAIYQFAIDRTTGSLVLESTIGGPLVNQPLSLQINERGHLFFISGGEIRELSQDASGAWGPAPDSVLAGMPAHRRLAIAVGRTNFDDATMLGPEFRNLDLLEAPGIPDCYANCDQSTSAPVLNIDDFMCFINAFSEAQSLSREEQILHYANCDNSTSNPILNVDDFMCFINAFAEGCQ